MPSPDPFDAAPGQGRPIGVTVITYGTFDLFHEGHRRLLERARSLGDHLIVGVTTQAYDDSRGKLNIVQPLVQRLRNVADSGLADEIIVEEYEGQKIHDISKHGVDIFAIGSDWQGKFDYLNPYCRVVYLERTKGISSTQLRNEPGVLRMGVVGAGRIAQRFVQESRYVSGVNVESVLSRGRAGAEALAERFELSRVYDDLSVMLGDVDAVYLASPHEAHVEQARAAITAGVHVLCEKPMALTKAEVAGLFELANQRSVTLVEAVKTAFAPGFQRLVAVARSGSIGQIRHVEATFTKLVAEGRERALPHGGAIAELGTYPFLALVKLLGIDHRSISTQVWQPPGQVDLFARATVEYGDAIGSAVVGIGVKSEGSLVVSGTEGYLYAPAPWWLTEYFETRFEDPRDNKKYFQNFEGDGLRYELAEFVRLVRSGARESYKLLQEESLAIAGLIEQARAEQQRFAVGLPG